MNATRTIWKFQFAPGPNPPIDLPSGSQFLSVANQGGVITAWFEVDPGRPMEARTFDVYGTGWNIANGRARYRGTCLVGPLVWPLYEVPTTKESACTTP